MKLDTLPLITRRLFERSAFLNTQLLYEHDLQDVICPIVK